MQVFSGLQNILCGKCASTDTKRDEREGEDRRESSQIPSRPMAVCRLVYAHKQLPKSLYLYSVVRLSLLPFACIGIFNN